MMRSGDKMSYVQFDNDYVLMVKGSIEGVVRALNQGGG
jgi:hypothetical protein